MKSPFPKHYATRPVTGVFVEIVWPDLYDGPPLNGEAKYFSSTMKASSFFGYKSDVIGELMAKARKRGELIFVDFKGCLAISVADRGLEAGFNHFVKEFSSYRKPLFPNSRTAVSYEI